MNINNVSSPSSGILLNFMQHLVHTRIKFKASHLLVNFIASGYSITISNQTTGCPNLSIRKILRKK